MGCVAPSSVFQTHSEQQGGAVHLVALVTLVLHLAAHSVLQAMEGAVGWTFWNTARDSCQWKQLIRVSNVYTHRHTQTRVSA